MTRLIIIDDDELHIIKLLLNVSITVKIEDATSHSFVTDTGGPQGDCCSATEFTLYLAKSLEKYYESKKAGTDHDYIKTSNKNNINHIEEHNYYTQTQTKHFNINMEYADDISKVSSDYNESEQTKIEIQEVLEKRNLMINDSKTEQFHITKKNNKWTKCKLLGSFIDTETDIKYRKSLLLNAAKNLKDIFHHKKLPISIKMKTFNVYLSTIFLHNSELWSLTEKMCKSIDSFQRRTLRTLVFNVKYPVIISNNEVYEKTKQLPWSKVINIRRLRFLGHVCRLNELTPVRISLQYAIDKYKKKIGRPKTTWIKIVEEQLKDLNVKLADMFKTANDREKWRQLINTCYRM